MEKFKTNIQAVQALNIADEAKELFVMLCVNAEKAFTNDENKSAYLLSLYIGTELFAKGIDDSILILASQKKFQDIEEYTKLNDLYNEFLKLLVSYLDVKLPERVQTDADVPGATA
jgi:hypothetical protein